MNDSLIKNLCDFIEASPTAFHAVEAIVDSLEEIGAIQLDERERWHLEPGHTYFVILSGSSLISFRPGLRRPAETGFILEGAHTDSPGLKARLEKNLTGKSFEWAPVELYGDPIVSTWLDRPLSLAGRVIVKGDTGKAESRLVHLAEPVGLVPNLAIHLNRDINKGFEYNAQTHLPVLLSASGKSSAKNGGEETATASALLRFVAENLQIKAETILGSDLYFVDAQKPALLGPSDELVNGYRLDDLLGCHAILEAFRSVVPADHTQVACFLDNEEVGSRSIQGADSSFLRDILSRISALQDETHEDFYRAVASSFCISVDVAQAYHGSYPEKFDEDYAPILNGGPALKKTVDVGAPLLSMHSIRETVGALDHEMMVAALRSGFIGE